MESCLDNDLHILGLLYEVCVAPQLALNTKLQVDTVSSVPREESCCNDYVHTLGLLPKSAICLNTKAETVDRCTSA